MTSKARSLLISGCLLLVLAGIPLEAFAPPPPPDGSLIWHTYQGGDLPIDGVNHDRATGMAMDAAGDLYVVGSSVAAWNAAVDALNPVNPHTSNVDGVFLNPTNQDVFVARFDPDGNLVWHTFLGASPYYISPYYGWVGQDEGLGIAVDDSGGVFVTGFSTTTWGTPIVGIGGDQFNTEAFLAKLDANTGALVWNTFMGGGSWSGDQGNGVAVDGAGNIYVTGQSQYAWGTDPIRDYYGGYGGDAFVVKFDASGNRQWHTFLGGTNLDKGLDITLDASGNIFVVGASAYGDPGYCPSTDPGVAWCDTSAAQLKDPMVGGGDAFLAKLTSSGDLDWYAFHGGGGTDFDEAYGVAGDGAGHVFITGVSFTPWTAPVTVQPHIPGYQDDAFVAKIDAATGALLRNTFMGESGHDVVVGGDGHVYVGGVSAYGYLSYEDAFACKLDNDLGQEWCRHLFSDADGFPTCGGNDYGRGLAVSADDSVFLTGYSDLQCDDPEPLNDHTDPSKGADMLLARLYAGLSDANSIGMIIDDQSRAHIFDPVTDTVTAVVDIQWGEAEGDCAISPDGSLGFATNFGYAVQVIDLTTSPPSYAGDIAISNAGEDLSISPDGQFMVVSDGFNYGPLSVVDIATLSQIGTASLSGNDHASVDVCSDGTVLAHSYNNHLLYAGAIDGAGLITPGSTASLTYGINTLCAPGSATALGVDFYDGLFSYSLPALTLLDSVDPDDQWYTSAEINAAGTRVFLRSMNGVYAYEYEPSTGIFSSQLWFTSLVNLNLYFGMDQLRLSPGGSKLYVGNVVGPAVILDPGDGTILGHVTSGIPSMVMPTGICFGGLYQAESENVVPLADNQSLSFAEDSSANPITLTASDENVATLSFAVVGGSGPDHGTLGGTAPNLTYTPAADYFGPDSFQFTSTDEDGATSDPATVSITVTPVNDPPAINVSRATATVQYSDTIGTVTITASDVDDDPLTLGFEYSDNGGVPVMGLPSALGAAGSCTTVPNATVADGTSCSWDLSGQMLEDAGDYDITVAVTDGGGGTATAESASTVTEIIVLPEQATVSFAGANPVAVEVDSPGGDSQSFDLTVYVEETEPDLANFSAMFGNLSLAVPHMVLTPVGPGGPESPDSCAAPAVAGAGYGQVMTFTCHFSAVPVNTYSVDVSVNGGYYTGANDDVLTVFDPSLGFTTGGGWFYWPGTDDRTNFGYTMKYNKKARNIQGSLLVIRHVAGAPEGADKWRIKSNALEGLSLGTDGSPEYGWASFSGKATFKAPGADTEGNHGFTVYVEDHGEPGAGADRFWLQTRDREDDAISEVSMPFPGAGHSMTIEGGNILVPHKPGGRGRH